MWAEGAMCVGALAIYNLRNLFLHFILQSVSIKFSAKDSLLDNLHWTSKQIKQVINQFVKAG